MMEYEIAVRQSEDDLGRPHQFHYFLTVDSVETDRFYCEDYGVRVAEKEGESTCVPSITTSAVRIDELMTLLVDHHVSPTGLPHVVEDWL